jgi:hypothetical protein
MPVAKRNRNDSAIAFSNRYSTGESSIPSQENGLIKRKESEALSELAKIIAQSRVPGDEDTSNEDSHSSSDELEQPEGANDAQQGTTQNQAQAAQEGQNKTELSKQCKEILAMDTFDLPGASQLEAAQKTQIEDSARLLNTKSRFTVLYLRKACMWLCNYRDIRLARPYLTAWDVLRWNARSMTMLFVGGCSCVFSTVTAIIYIAAGFPLAAVALGLHAIALMMSFCWLRIVNVYRRSSSESH